MSNLSILEELIGADLLAKVVLSMAGAVIKIPSKRTTPSIRKNLTIDPSDFPQSLENLVLLIGVDAMINLVTEYKGWTLYVPSRITASHRIAKTVGLDVAQKISDSFGGQKFEVNQCYSVLRKIRHHEILSAVENRGDESIASVCRHYGCSYKTLWAIKAKYKNN